MDKSGNKHMMKECLKSRDKHMKECLIWILMVSVSPIAFLLFMLMALYSLLRFLCKATLLFIIVAINTPFAVMYNLSIIVFQYQVARLRGSSSAHWNWSDPRVTVGVEVKLLVSDFLKVIGGELLLFLSTGIITYYTAPLRVFYVSTFVWVGGMLYKWLNTNCVSKTALSCLCDGYGLSPMMFLFSFIGFFDIGCHPIAKCSFVACKAFLFVKDGPNQLSKEDVQNQLYTIVHPIVDPIVNMISFSRIDYQRIVVDPIVKEIRFSQMFNERNPNHDKTSYEIAEDVSISIHQGIEESLKKSDIFENYVDEVDSDLDEEEAKETPKPSRMYARMLHYEEPKELDQIGGDIEQGNKGINLQVDQIGGDIEQGNKKHNAKEIDPPRFNRATIDPKQKFVEFSKWNAFERGLFQLSPRIDFIERNHGKYILKSFMVLKILEVNLCEYPVERLELPEDYSKVNELYNFLDDLSKANGFVTNKMRGRYEHSLTLLEIVEGVQENDTYRIESPKDKLFVVA